MSRSFAHWSARQPVVYTMNTTNSCGYQPATIRRISAGQSYSLRGYSVTRWPPQPQWPYHIDETSIPTVCETLPIIAHRAALIDVVRPVAYVDCQCNACEVARSRIHETSVRLRSISYIHHVLAVEQLARCTRDVTHQAPVLGCSCGFYAVPIGVATPRWFEDLSVDLLVELSGRVIEHETGYRAQHQRILEVRVNRCPCGDVPSRLGQSGRYHRCDRCLSNMWGLDVPLGVDLGELSRLLQLPVRVLEPNEVA